MTDPTLLRKIPQVDAVLRHPAVTVVVDAWGPALARRLVQDEIARQRDAAQRGTEPDGLDAIAARVGERATALDRRRVRRVINATGVVLHTNLGRAPLSPAAVDAAGDAAGYAALEYDLATGERAARAPVAATILAALTGAEAALVVNNNAAAVLLALAGIARGREVIVSRGELIEIGGEFRLPEIMEASGGIVREVGTTNRTHGKDYRRAINDGTALVLVVHPSNYRVVGFTARPSLEEIVAIAHEADVPVLYDIGSGLLHADPSAPDEPDAAGALDAGCDLVCFSGDKLIGGPQAGVLAGRTQLIEACRRNPIARAVRADKMTLAALEATALAHARGRADELPAVGMIAVDASTLRARAERIVATLPQGIATVEDGESVTGAGSLPGRALPTTTIAVPHEHPARLAARLRDNDPPIIARVDANKLLLDLRTVPARDDRSLSDALRHVLGA